MYVQNTVRVLLLNAGGNKPSIRDRNYASLLKLFWPVFLLNISLIWPSGSFCHACAIWGTKCMSFYESY